MILLLLALSMSRTPEPTESVPDLLRRQTQELVDAVSSGSADVWNRYLDPNARYVDESGNVLTKKEMVEGIRPLPAGVSGTIAVTNFDAAVHGDVAVTTHIDDENEDYHGHKIHCRYRTTDAWKKTPQGWRLIAGQVLAMRTDPPSIPLPASLRNEYCGHYALTPTIAYEIRCNGESLEGRQTGREPQTLLAEAPDVLFVAGRPRYRYVFQRDAAGRITGLAQRREAWDLIWKRIDPAKP